MCGELTVTHRIQLILFGSVQSMRISDILSRIINFAYTKASAFYFAVVMLYTF